MSVIYRQYDSRWGNLSYPSGNTMAGSGCGPTACANVIANISNSSVTPKDTRTFMLNHGYAVRNAGTAWAGIPACLQNWGYVVKNCPDMKTVWAECAKGDEQGVILFTAGTKGGVTWTTDGHFVAFTDYRIENGKHYFYTRDSGPRKNDGWHCYETTMQGLIPAIWTCHHKSVGATYYIEYDANGGTGAPAKQSYTHSDTEYTYLSKTIPTRSGYIFNGWSLDKNATKGWPAGEKFGRWSHPSSGNTYHLYATWVKQSVIKIHYDANGGTGAPSDQSYTYSATGYTYLSKVIPTREGYTFNGWALDKNATSGWTAGEKIGRWSKPSTGDTYYLYATWKKQVIVIIRYNANGGLNAPDEQSYVLSDTGTYQLTTDVPARDGYKFLGWSTNKNATKASYQPGQAWAKTNSGPIYTLYAIWQKIETKKGYTGTFPTGVIVKGSTGENVKNLQKFINWWRGKNVLDTDGICGNATVSEIKAFQKYCKLEADGICGEKTIAAMKAVRK